MSAIIASTYNCQKKVIWKIHSECLIAFLLPFCGTFRESTKLNNDCQNNPIGTRNVSPKVRYISRITVPSSVFKISRNHSSQGWSQCPQMTLRFLVNLKCLRTAVVQRSAWQLWFSGFPIWHVARRRGFWKPWQRQIFIFLTQEPFQESRVRTLHSTQKALKAHFAWRYFGL